MNEFVCAFLTEWMECWETQHLTLVHSTLDMVSIYMLIFVWPYLKYSWLEGTICCLKGKLTVMIVLTSVWSAVEQYDRPTKRQSRFLFELGRSSPSTSCRAMWCSTIQGDMYWQFTDVSAAPVLDYTEYIPGLGSTTVNSQSEHCPVNCQLKTELTPTLGHSGFASTTGDRLDWSGFEFWIVW